MGRALAHVLMPESHNQKSFHAGEWSPNLYARVDLAKYHSAAATLQNFFVDYRGGASTRTGTQYILQARTSSAAVRLIPFSASFTVSYVLEFGDFYIRFYNNGAPVLEPARNISAISLANPCQVTEVVAHGRSTGDWVFLRGIVGTTQLNNRYFKIIVTGASTYTLTDLNGVPINSSAYTAYVSGGSAATVFTLPSPYAAADLALLKFAQSVNTMVLTHPSYPPYTLTLISATSWLLVSIVFGASISAPTAVGVTTTLGAGSVNYAYVVTSVDANGQESSPSTAATLANKLDLTTTAGTNIISWTAAAGALSYNVYKSTRSYAGAVPAGASFGYIGFTTGVSFVDTTGLGTDFAETPPIPKNPFLGGSLASITVTAPGAYTSVPSVIVAPPSSGQTATAVAALSIIGTPVIATSNNGFGVGQAVYAQPPGAGTIILIIATVNGSGAILTFQPVTYPGSNPGLVSSGATPANNVAFNAVLGGGGLGGTVTLTWGVTSVSLTAAGTGYTAAPAVTFSAGAAAATAVLGPTSAGNPSVPAYFQQRLALAAPSGAPQTFYMSKPGAPYNFDISNPIQPDDSITGTIVSNQLNEIKSMISMPQGLVMLSSRQAWQITGGGQGAVTPIDVTANAQAYNGASDVPPIVANYDILYVQSKGSIVRDLSYNFYTNIYTGTDISILSSHLFFGYSISEWAYAEEPFKIVWAVRNDGTLLSLTFLKEQEVVGWAHSITNGTFESVASVTETVTQGAVDATYVVVERVVNGNTVKYIERMADRFLSSGGVPNRYTWCVDAGLQYIGAPATTFTGAEHLAGLTVTGLADGVVITPFVMPTNGFFTLTPAASTVTLGLAYTCILKTLILDIGEPTTIGKLKKIIAATVRCADTLGITFGRSLSSLVALKDFSGVTNAQGITLTGGLTTADARQPIDPLWDQDGQYYIVQSQPLPATILGVVPEFKTEDRK